MADITIITPAYNRGKLLERLYESLLKQTDKRFDWLIVDDGSTDDTKQRVESWLESKELRINYIWQENGGKHRALNNGIQEVVSDLTFIVDSDDYLPEDAIETILAYHDKYKEKRKELRLCGYSFLRFYSNGEVNTAYFPKDEEVATYLEVRINGNIGGDKAEVFYTKALKKYPFPEFPQEKFMPEDTVWMRMSEEYNMVHINRCVYFSDYLECGLTKSGRKMKLKSPKGMALRSKIYLNSGEVNYKVKVKMMLLYHIYGKAAGFLAKEMLAEVGNKALFLLCFVPGRIIYRCWSGQVSSE